MKKLFQISALFAAVIFFFGLIYSDPYSSKSGYSSEETYTPSIMQTDALAEKYVDNFDGANDTTALKTRGYTLRRGPAHGPIGSTYWFQGNSTVFPAYNGPATGYVAANFNATTGANTIDLWLILPPISLGVGAGDTISLWTRSPTGSIWPDSIRIHYSASGDSTPGSSSFVELGRFKTSTTAWTESRYVAPTAGLNGRFAINYRVVDGGPAGNNSDYIGIDYVRILGPLSGIVPTGEIATAFSLSQNYPNPFNPSTKIKFAIPKGETVKLVVYDAAGKEVKTLVNGYKDAGTYEVTFDASKLATGIYMYKITAGEFSSVKKMVLVK